MEQSDFIQFENRKYGPVSQVSYGETKVSHDRVVKDVSQLSCQVRQDQPLAPGSRQAMQCKYEAESQV